MNENKETETTGKDRTTSRFGVERIVMRFIFAFVHFWLAVTHFWCVEEGKQFFRDESTGRKSRLKKDKINRILSKMKGA